jgi:hypothetical protein
MLIDNFLSCLLCLITYFIGLIQPLGAIMPLAEVQSEWVANLITGKSQLPDKEKMLADIKKYKEKLRKRYKHSPRHTIQVEFYPYKNMIKKMASV